MSHTPEQMRYSLAYWHGEYLKAIAFRVRNRNKLDIPAMREARKRGDITLKWKTG